MDEQKESIDRRKFLKRLTYTLAGGGGLGLIGSLATTPNLDKEKESENLDQEKAEAIKATATKLHVSENKIRGIVETEIVDTYAKEFAQRHGTFTARMEKMREDDAEAQARSLRLACAGVASMVGAHAALSQYRREEYSQSSAARH
jgi:hypothetical protein